MKTTKFQKRNNKRLMRELQILLKSQNVEISEGESYWDSYEAVEPVQRASQALQD